MPPSCTEAAKEEYGIVLNQKKHLIEGISEVSVFIKCGKGVKKHLWGFISTDF